VIRELELEEALVLVKRLLGRGELNEAQKAVFRGVWSRQSYQEIIDAAAEHGYYYSLGHLKNTGSELWQALGNRLGKRVTKHNLHEVLAHYQQTGNGSGAILRHQDWGDAPDAAVFYGRSEELTTLHHWVTQERCRVVAILGMGGMGKTTLAVRLAKQSQDAFQFVIWRSLLNAPPVEETLKEMLQFLSEQQEVDYPTSLEAQVTRLLHYLRQHRCLLILDNVESILQSGSSAGSYRLGYEEYGLLMQRIAETEHSSSLVITSREKPRDLARLEAVNSPVRSFTLKGLALSESRAIFQSKGCFGIADSELQTVCEHYAGNPLALNMVASGVQELFDGDLAELLPILHEGWLHFEDIQDVLSRQFERLSAAEQDVMYWLAVNREPVSHSELAADVVSVPSKQQLLEALQSLSRRCLIERNEKQWSLQPVVMEYVTQRLIAQACESIRQQQYDWLTQFALLKAQGKDYIRQAQSNLILQPLLECLLSHWGNCKTIEDQLKALLEKQRSAAPLQPGYLAGNVLNLLRQLRADLSGIDCSYLSIWQADLQDVKLHNANFAHAAFAKTVFNRTFGTVLAVVFSPDGEKMATSNANGEIHLWRVSDGQCLLTCQGHTNWVRKIAFSPSGSVLVSASEDRSLRLWDTESGRCLRTLVTDTPSIFYVAAFSPDEQTLVSGGDDAIIRFWDWQRGICLRELRGHSGWVLSGSFSPDGRLVVSSAADETIRLWDAQSGKCLRVLTEHRSWVLPVLFTPDGQRLVSSSLDQTIRLWDVQTGQCLHVLRGHHRWVWCIAVSRDGRLIASGSEDRTIKIWDMEGHCLRTIRGHTEQLWFVSFHPDSQRFASCGEDGTVRIWNVQDGKCLKVIRGYSDCIRSVIFDHSGQRLISGGKDQLIRIWHGPTHQHLYALAGHTGSVLAVSLHPDGRTLASCSEDHTIRLWDIEQQVCLQTLNGHSGGVWSVVFSPDGKTLASGSFDETIRLWDAQTGACLQVIPGYVTKTGLISFSPDGVHLAAASNNRNIHILNLQDSRQSYYLEGHVNWGRTATFSPDGQLLATGGIDETVRLWDLTSRQCIQTLTGHTGWVLATAFSPDGRWLASASCDHTVKLWNIQTGECVRTLEGHRNWVWSIAFSPEGQFLASASEDETIHLWNWRNGETLTTLRSQKLYEGLQLNGATGLTTAQRLSLRTLGAVESVPESQLEPCMSAQVS
jgi:WD40 repeat protein